MAFTFFSQFLFDACFEHYLVVHVWVLICYNSRSFDYTGRAESSRANIQMTHSATGPTVSLEEAQRIERETADHLLKSRKLSLIVDLDQTIVHATVDPTIGEWISEGQAWEERRKARREQRGERTNGTSGDGDGGSTTPEPPQDEDGSDEEDMVNPNWKALKDVKMFRLAPEVGKDKGKGKSFDPGCLYYVKPR